MNLGLHLITNDMDKVNHSDKPTSLYKEKMLVQNKSKYIAEDNFSKHMNMATIYISYN
jgi:hypothetical protein